MSDWLSVSLVEAGRGARKRKNLARSKRRDSDAAKGRHMLLCVVVCLPLCKKGRVRGRTGNVAGHLCLRDRRVNEHRMGPSAGRREVREREREQERRWEEERGGGACRKG